MHNFYDRVAAAQVHRETYVAVMNSALRNSGDKEYLAHQLGITPQYLSKLLNPATDTAAHTRTPGDDLAIRIAALLPLDPQVRSRLVEHMRLTWRYERHTSAPVLCFPKHPLMAHTVTDLLADIRDSLSSATSALDPAVSRKGYPLVREACRLLLKRVAPYPIQLATTQVSNAEYALEYVEACLTIADVECVLNRPDEALMHAKFARYIVETRDRDGYTSERGYFDHLAVWAVVSECMAYQHLKLYKQAYEATLDAEELAATLDSRQAYTWLQQIYLYRLRALIHRPRFPLAEVADLVKRASAAAEGIPSDLRQSCAVQIAESEALAYLQYGTPQSIRRADRMLRSAMDRLDLLAKAGPVQRTQLLRTYAKAKWKQNSLDEWRYYISWALEIALAAGLEYQVAEITCDYGLAVVGVMDDQDKPGRQISPASGGHILKGLVSIPQIVH